MTPDLMSSDEVCEFLKISRPTLYLWRRLGKVKPLRAGRRLLFVRHDIEALLAPRQAQDIEGALAVMRKGVIAGRVVPWHRAELYSDRIIE